MVVHWDGKAMKLKGKIESKRVCVYISGVNAEKVQKLLGIPESQSGRGVDEFNVVKEHLISWELREQVIGMVFDTTATNSGEESGACQFLEIWRDSPILWLACRHHIAELHIGTAVGVITGVKKDPGMAEFRRLRES